MPFPAFGVTVKLSTEPAATLCGVAGVMPPPLPADGVTRVVWFRSMMPARGTRAEEVVPSPNWPFPLSPQDTTVPPPLRPRLWVRPPARAVMPLSPGTWAASIRLVLVPSPSWPLELYPQLQSVPPLWRIRL